MTKTQKKALKVRLRRNLKFYKDEYKKMNALGSRLQLRRERVFKTAFSNIRKELRLFKRLNSKIR